jgi:hypothetical protein
MSLVGQNRVCRKITSPSQFAAAGSISDSNGLAPLDQSRSPVEFKIAVRVEFRSF